MSQIEFMCCQICMRPGGFQKENRVLVATIPQFIFNQLKARWLSTSPSEGETTRNKPIPKITYEQPPGIFNPEYKLERVRHYHFFSKCLLL